MRFLKPKNAGELSEARDYISGAKTGRMERHEDQGAGYVWYTTGPNEKGLFHGMGFSGKRMEPDFNYAFRTADQMAKYIDQWQKGLRESAAEKDKRRAVRKEFITTLKPGDILDGSWGYDQTQAEFWQVTGVKGNQVTIRKLCAELVPGSESRVMPRPGMFSNEYPEETRIAQPGNYVKCEFCSLSPWDGLPAYETPWDQQR